MLEYNNFFFLTKTLYVAVESILDDVAQMKWLVTGVMRILHNCCQQQLEFSWVYIESTTSSGHTIKGINGLCTVCTGLMGSYP
jgi:hypothetical protein